MGDMVNAGQTAGLQTELLQTSHKRLFLLLSVFSISSFLKSHVDKLWLFI